MVDGKGFNISFNCDELGIASGRGQILSFRLAAIYGLDCPDTSP